MGSEMCIRDSGKPLEEYFPVEAERNKIIEPLEVSETMSTYNVDATLSGGGKAGQAGAMRLGIARALVADDEAAGHEDVRPLLKKLKLLRRDPRKKESKKYGLKKARKAPQFSKR